MTSNLESEDLENVPLVRMEDVQPSRDRAYEVNSPEIGKEEVLETSIVDSVDYENECVMGNEDSNIGSMVSIKVEQASEGNDSNSGELIVPDFRETYEIPIEIKVEPETETKPAPCSWPTLEILPGGVIKNADKSEDSTAYSNDTDSADSGEMMYACAKCPQSFKYLFRLVKHVRWHEDQQKRQKGTGISKLTILQDNSEDRRVYSNYTDTTESGDMMYACAKCPQSFKYLSQLMKHVRWHEDDQKKERWTGIPKLKAKEDKCVCLHSVKKKIISKTNKRKIPKKNKS